MTNQKITTLIFDLGQVVLTNDWLIPNVEKDREFYGYYNITSEVFMTARNRHILDLQTGKISEDLYWRLVLDEAKANPSDTKTASEIMRKYQSEIPGMFTFLLNLKQNGFKLACITTTHKEIIDWKIEHFNLYNYFSLIITSSDAGWVKPDERIYQYTLDKLYVIPEACIFIDDTQENVNGAIKVGLKGIKFKNAPELKKEFNKLGILV
jgi:epoxide hydrolase-like predicted phosphatase